MCIIAYAPSGVAIKEETIRIMFKGNPDGAGLMWKPTDNSLVEIRKGFFKVEELIKAYNKIPVDCEKAIHCRIATAGKISVGCCHPFPVRAKTEAMTKAKDKADVVLMHNGVISYCNPKQGMKASYSDSMLFAKDILYPLSKQLDRKPIQTLIEESTDSRLLIMRQYGETLMFGNWKFEDGVYYSNSNYKPWQERFSFTKRGCYGYDYGDYWWKYDKASTAKSDGKSEVQSNVEKALNDDGYDDCCNPSDYYGYWIDVDITGHDTDDASSLVIECLEEEGVFVNDYWVEKHAEKSFLSLEVESINPISLTLDSIAGYPVQYITKL